MKKRILITGGAGYFGSVLVQKLIERGHDCRVFDIANEDQVVTDATYIHGDIRNIDAIRKACEGVDIIHHNVAQVPLAKDKDLFRSVNIGGTENLLQAALEANVKKVIYTSSSAVYGVPSQNPVFETHIPKPGEAYGAAKLEGETLCKNFIKKGLDISIIRPRTIIGHGRLGIFQILFEWIAEGRNVPVLGKGDNLYQFVHADDLAECCILAGERKGSEIYNCGATDFGSMRETLENLCQHAGTGSKVVSLPFRLAVHGMNISSALGLSPLGAYHSLMYGRSMYFDTTKAETELKWQPTFSNSEMFKGAYDWYLENRESVHKNLTSYSPHKELKRVTFNKHNS